MNAAQDSTDLVDKLRAFHNEAQVNPERKNLKWWVYDFLVFYCQLLWVCFKFITVPLSLPVPLGNIWRDLSHTETLQASLLLGAYMCNGGCWFLALLLLDVISGPHSDSLGGLEEVQEGGLRLFSPFQAAPSAYSECSLRTVCPSEDVIKHT